MPDTSDVDWGTPHPLIASGWIPGALFQAPGASYEINAFESGKNILLPGTPGQVRKVRSSEQLIVISHICDIVAADEKYIEALIVKTEDPTHRLLAAWERNSTRHFIVDRDIALVAEASHRIKITKSSLNSLKAAAPVFDQDQQERFEVWLARRYLRSTVSDAMYKKFHRKFYDLLMVWSESKKDLLDIFNEAVCEPRITENLANAWPATVGMIYLTYRQALSKSEQEVIKRFHQELSNSVAPHVNLNEPVIQWIDDVPYGVIRRSQEVYAEYLSNDLDLGS